MKKSLVIIPLVFLLFFTMSCQKQEEGLSREEAKTIIEDFIKFRNEGDLAAADKVIHPNCVIKYSNLPQTIVGLDAYKEYDKATRIAFPDFKMAINQLMVIDDKIIAYWELDATNSGPLMLPNGTIPPTNVKVHIKGIGVSTVVDGKIKEDVAYFDMLDMIMQLGFTLNPPQMEQSQEQEK